ncbi:hypothetical protein [Streptomyces sp. NPDC058294]|uniref:hypothetical protein n=1 Tax=Streptomyces sp. NPDC058294 TaxID=3346430 RepID=UPI0036E4CFB7
MTATARGRIPRLICVSCASGVLFISAGAVTAVAATPSLRDVPVQQISKDNSGGGVQGSDSSGSSTSTDNGGNDTSSNTGDQSGNGSDTGNQPNTPSGNGGTTDTTHNGGGNGGTTDTTHNGGGNGGTTDTTHNGGGNGGKGKNDKKGCRHVEGLAANWCTHEFRNPSGLKNPNGAKGTVLNETVKVTVQELGFDPACNLGEGMEGVHRITYVGYVYTDASGHKYQKSYSTWSYGKGNTTVSGPYTVVQKIDQGWTCLKTALGTGGA